MSANIKDVVAGEGLSAATENVIRDIIRKVQSVSGINGVTANLAERGLLISGRDELDFSALVKEATGHLIAIDENNGDDYSPYEVLAIDQDGQPFTAAEVVSEETTLEIRPTKRGDVGRWVVVMDGMINSIETGTGRVAASGIYPVYVVREEMNEDVALRAAEMTVDKRYLTMVPMGSATVLWEDDTAEDLKEPHLALVQFDQGAGMARTVEKVGEVPDPEGGTYDDRFYMKYTDSEGEVDEDAEQFAVRIGV